MRWSCPTFLRSLFPQISLVCQGSQGWNGRERERRMQKTPTRLHYSLSFPCSNLLHVLGKESTSPGSTTSSTELDRPPQGAPVHPFSVTPVDEHQSLGRDRTGENGESCCSQRGGNDKEGSDGDVAEKGQQRWKGHLPTPLNSKPSSPCCHSTLQRTVLRKSHG